jgi:hypothetical protein
MQSDANAGLLLLVFLLVAYSIYRSKKKLKTILYSVCGLVGGILATVSLAPVFPYVPKSAIGAASVYVGELTTCLVSLMHSRSTLKKMHSSDVAAHSNR